MAMWRMEDDCLAPEAKTRIDYVGPEPFRIVSEMKETLRQTLGKETKDVWERDFRWDITDDPRMFYTRYMVSERPDANSMILWEVTVQGFQPADPAKNGKVVILVGGVVMTDWDLDSAFKKTPLYNGKIKIFGRYEMGGLLWVYHRLFYNDVRRVLIHKCAEKCEELVLAMRRTLKIPEPEKAM